MYHSLKWESNIQPQRPLTLIISIESNKKLTKSNLVVNILKFPFKRGETAAETVQD